MQANVDIRIGTHKMTSCDKNRLFPQGPSLPLKITNGARLPRQYTHLHYPSRRIAELRRHEIFAIVPLEIAKRQGGTGRHHSGLLS